MELGTFSVSLNVADLPASRVFYETFGFSSVGGDEENWIILSNGTTNIGLFHGMFEENIMTFNPTDARAIEKVALDAGLELQLQTEGDEGPAHFVLEDPDGNTVMFDQH